MPDPFMSLRSSFPRTERVDDTQAARVEHVLGVGRSALALSGLVAIYFDPTEPARFASLTYSILVAYAVSSAVILAWLQRISRLKPSHSYSLHALDILFASIVTFLSDGPGSPLFLFFLFVVAAS